MLGIFEPMIIWIRDNWYSGKFRFIIELLAWAISIGCSVTMARTIPTFPLIILYPIWIAGCAVVRYGALCTLGLLMLGKYLECWLTTSC